MSSLMDGISSAQKFTTQIEALKSGEETPATTATAAVGQASLQDPEALQLQLQQNFNDMLSDLLSTSNDDDDDDNDDYFADFFSQYTNPLSSYGQAAQTAAGTETATKTEESEVSAAVLNQAGLSNDLTQSSYLTGLQGNILLNQTISQL
jgi:hypothetical protein